MNGAIPGSTAESMRQLSVRFPAGAFSGSSSPAGKNTNAGLFEHLLSMPAPARIPPSRPTSPSPTSPSSTTSSPATCTAADGETSENGSTDAGPVADSQAEKRPTAAEEETASETIDDQLAVVSAIPSAATGTTAATSASDATAATEDQPVAHSPEQPIADDQTLAEQGGGEQPADAEQLTIPEAESGHAAAEAVATGAGGALRGEAPEKAAPRTRAAKSEPQQQQPTIPGNSAQPVAELVQENQPQSPDAQLASKENAVDATSAVPVREADPAAATSEADGQPNRGGNRGKWYERRSANSPAAAAAEAPAARVNAAETPAISATALAEVSAGEATGQEGPSLSGPAPSPSPAPAPAVVVGSAQTVADSIASTLLSGNRLSQSAGQTETGEATAAPRNVELANPANRSSGHEAKAAAPDAQRPDGLTQAERVRMVQRISRSFARLGPTGGAINIKLHPPQLGALNVQVKMEGRTMTAKLSTESAAAREVILESLPVLRGRLAEQGFEIASFQVEVADNNADAGSFNQQQSAGQSSGEERQFGRQVDYRRVAAMQRQQGEGPVNHPLPASRSGIAWQSMAHMDLQA